MTGGCGTNTSTPVYPLLATLSTVGVPAIISVTPVEVAALPPNVKIEFDLKYYITNQEKEFIGYNLYISTTDTSSLVASGKPYLPDGIEPSFPHVGATPSTAPADLITKRITDFKPAPSPIPFRICELYYFSLQAVTRNGIKSIPGNRVTACASTQPSLCPVGTGCNP